MYPFLNFSLVNSCTSLLFFLNNKYTFPFLGINHFFNSITWSDIFFIGILSLAFFLKTWIHLWNCWETNFLASSLDFSASSSSFQISIPLLSSSPLLFFSFSVFFLFSASLLYFSSSFYFCYLNFLCFSLHYLPHSSRHLFIFTSPIIQTISGLLQPSHSISKITLYFSPPIISIFILSLCS